MKSFKKILNILYDLFIFILSPLFFISKMLTSEKLFKFVNSKKYIVCIISFIISLTIFLLLYFFY